MGKKKQDSGTMIAIANGEVSRELDPQPWEHLSNDLMEIVLSKLPFANLVKLRLVAKLWRSSIIPRAAQESQALRNCALLCFSSDDERPQGPRVPLWFKFHKSDSHSIATFEKLVSVSFPPSEIGETIRLVHSEDGVLFYGFVQWATYMMSKLVACNPLTGHCRVLMLPRPIQWRSLNWTLLVGVVFDAKKQHYRLVIAGLDEACILVTFVYNSATTSWTSCPCILPDVSEGITYCTLNRSVSCNGNSYWCSMSMSPSVAGQRHFVLNFDFQQSTWTFIPFRPWGCLDESLDSCQIVSHNGQILLWHLHMSRLSWERPEDRDLPCRHPLTENFPPEIKLMQSEWIETLCALERENFSANIHLDYFAFKQGSFFYHVLYVIPVGEGEENTRLKIVAQDVEDNSFSRLPVEWQGLHLRNIWPFSASLTALP